MTNYISDDMSEENEQHSPSDLMQVITFALGNKIFGVDILTVHEVIRSASFTPVPNSPAFIEGVINRRGNIFPVIDLKKKLSIYGERKQSDNIWIIILDLEDCMTGFIVDRVIKAHKVFQEDVEQEPLDTEEKIKRELISCIARIDGKRIPVLDVNRIMFGKKMDTVPDKEMT